MTNLNNKDCKSVLLETNNYFQSIGYNPLGQGYSEIASNATLFEQYADRLTEGCSADSKALIEQLMANTNMEILRESATVGISPIASLSMPVIRRLWPKFALKEALKTEVAKKPVFVVSYTKPYLSKIDPETHKETRVDLPAGLKGPNGYLSAAGRKEAVVKDLTVNVGANLVQDLSEDTKYQALDRDFQITQVSFTDTEAYVGKVNRTIDINNMLYADVDCYEVTEEPSKKHKQLTLIAKVDLEAASVTLNVISGGKDKVTAATPITVGINAGVSSERNEDAWSVGFNIERMDIKIPTGQHLNAPLTIEALNDMNAMYSINGEDEVVDLMTQVFDQKLDMDVLEFLEASYINQPNMQFPNNPTADKLEVTFDCRPAAGFAGAPKAWREEIKPLIDYLATEIRKNTYLDTGIFTLIGNPTDVNIITNVDWQLRGGTGNTMDGVAVNYDVGTFQAQSNIYKVISSVNVPQGEMLLFFTPSSEKTMTYKYYPYTFSIEKGYRDPNQPNVPSLMMTRRHTFKEFLPAIGCITVLNNDGSSYFNQYVATKAIV